MGKFKVQSSESKAQSAEWASPRKGQWYLEQVFNWKKAGICNGSRERNEVKRPDFSAKTTHPHAIRSLRDASFPAAIGG